MSLASGGPIRRHILIASPFPTIELRGLENGQVSFEWKDYAHRSRTVLRLAPRGNVRALSTIRNQRNTLYESPRQKPKLRSLNRCFFNLLRCYSKAAGDLRTKTIKISARGIPLLSTTGIRSHHESLLRSRITATGTKHRGCEVFWLDSDESWTIHTATQRLDRHAEYA